jgi:hypothetical protein
MDFSAEHWARLISWLSQAQDTASVQAIAAVASFLATVGLLLVTFWYVKLTHQLWQTNHRHLHVALQPCIALSFAREQ